MTTVVKFLSTRGLPFRGANQKLGSSKNGNYLGAIELISEYDPFLKTLFKMYGNKGSGVTSYLSANIYDEIIQLMGKKVFSFIINELKTAKYYSISVDSTPDVSHEDQLTFTVRYVINDGPVERFLKFIPIGAHGAEYLSDVILNFLKENEINVNDCRGKSYDNAVNVSGVYSSLQARLKKENKHAEYVPCAGHSLNLGAQGAEYTWQVTQFFSLVQKLYTFFSAATVRWQKLQTALGSNKKNVKSLLITRWSARSDAVMLVLYMTDIMIL